MTEERIIEIALRYLRGHYKYRPRVDEIAIRARLRGGQNLVADGMLSFTTPQGTPFTITFEATDYFKRDELWYKVLWPLAFWDAGAAASVVGSFSILFLHWNKHLGLMHSWPYLFWAIAFLGAVILTLLVYKVLLPLRRYRYVYAIEQFKAYFADDQWVTFSSDVFPGYEDPLFKEVRERCIYNGFGLLEILPDEKVKLHLTPARGALAGRKTRKLVSFLTESDWSKAVQGRMRSVNWRDRLGRFLVRVAKRPELDDLLRFKRPIWRQLTICTLSTMLLVAVLIREYGRRPLIYENEEAFVKRMEALSAQLEAKGPESNIPVLLDSASVWPFEKNTLPYLKLIPESLPAQARVSFTSGYLAYQSGKLKTYSCDQAFQAVKGKFVVLSGSFFDLDYLKSILFRLRENRIPVNGLWAECLFPKRGYYVLILEQAYSSLEEAERAQGDLIAFLVSQGLLLETRIERVEGE
ncbi:MAG: hypothetical protein IPH16_11415 [Haliscomenobacter sp.]|nr:hypothetical protein [Haliscomenobacter sp.]MBK7474686.1 hypothetical protein [Haliscomenobacter sp.]MBK8877667.1 hypothetical protein [Haliscomenobacter sp.]